MCGSAPRVKSPPPPQPPPEVPSVTPGNILRDKKDNKLKLGKSRLQIPLGAEMTPVGLGIPE